ncbi:MAG: lipocalin family protein [Bacteroidota bacterium]
MKRLLIFCFLILPLGVYSQNTLTVVKKDLVGTWVIKEIKINGVNKPDYDPSVQDEMILRENDTQTTTNKAYDYEQSGPWRIINGKYIELTDSEENEKQLLEIISFDQSVLKVRIKQDETLIEMTLKKKQQPLTANRYGAF